MLCLPPTPESPSDHLHGCGGRLAHQRPRDRPEDTGARPAALLGGLKDDEPIRTFRTSLNLLGDGFVEAISNDTLLQIAADQPNDTVSGNLVQGEAVIVPIEEAGHARHREAKIVRDNFFNLSPAEQTFVITFLESL